MGYFSQLHSTLHYMMCSKTKRTGLKMKCLLNQKPGLVVTNVSTGTSGTVEVLKTEAEKC